MAQVGDEAGVGGGATRSCLVVNVNDNEIVTVEAFVRESKEGYGVGVPGYSEHPSALGKIDVQHCHGLLYYRGEGNGGGLEVGEVVGESPLGASPLAGPPVSGLLEARPADRGGKG